MNTILKIKSLYYYFRAGLAFIFLGIPLMFYIILNPKSVYKTSSFLCKILFKCLGIKYNITGKLPNHGPFIIMHNHSSFLDMFFIPIIMKGKYTGVIAAKNFKIPIVSVALKKLKAIPIFRSNRTQAIQGIKIAEQRIKEGFNIVIFPEGTRTITGKLSQLKKGGFHMAKNTQTKIIPIIVKGLYEIKPKTRWSLNTKVVAQMIIEEPLDIINYSVTESIEKLNNLFEKHGLEVTR